MCWVDPNFTRERPWTRIRKSEKIGWQKKDIPRPECHSSDKDPKEHVIRKLERIGLGKDSKDRRIPMNSRPALAINASPLLSPIVKNKKGENSVVKAVLHHHTLVVPSWLWWVLRLLNLSDHQIERFRDVEVEEGTGLSEPTVEFFRQLPTFIKSHLSLVTLQITLISHYDQWYLVGTLLESKGLEKFQIDRAGGMSIRK